MGVAKSLVQLIDINCRLFHCERLCRHGWRWNQLDQQVKHVAAEVCLHYGFARCRDDAATMAVDLHLMAIVHNEGCGQEVLGHLQCREDVMNGNPLCCPVDGDGGLDGAMTEHWASVVVAE